MRRPRPHRLTGSVRRLLAGALLALLVGLFAVTAAAPAASAAGLRLTGRAGNIVTLGLPVVLPSVAPFPTPPAPTPSQSAPGLPGSALVPAVCPPQCTPTSAAAASGPTGPRPALPGTTHGAPAGRSARPGSLQPALALGGGAATATTALTVPQTLGLSLSPPPAVQQLTPLAGISFGNAPYMWPLFVLLDVVAAAAVILLVRRTWSASSCAD